MSQGRATEVALRRATHRRTLAIVPRRPNRHPWTRRAGALLLASVVCASSAAVALAEGGEVSSVHRHGECSGPSAWTFAVRRLDGGMLGVRLAVAGGRAGQKWNVFMDHNGVGFFAGSRTSGTGGYFAVRQRVPNLAGVDTIRFGANNPAPVSETCRGRTSL